MKLLLAFVLALVPLPVIAESGPSFDLGTALISYGVAAPFAALCFWQMVNAQKRSDAKNKVIDGKDKEIAALQQARVETEREFAARLAPLLYDGARLYQAGNERLTQGLAHTATDLEVGELKKSVEELLRRLGEGEGR